MRENWWSCPRFLIFKLFALVYIYIYYKREHQKDCNYLQEEQAIIDFVIYEGILLYSNLEFIHTTFQIPFSILEPGHIFWLSICPWNFLLQVIKAFKSSFLFMRSDDQAPFTFLLSDLIIFIKYFQRKRRLSESRFIEKLFSMVWQ